MLLPYMRYYIAVPNLLAAIVVTVGIKLATSLYSLHPLKAFSMSRRGKSAKQSFAKSISIYGKPKKRIIKIHAPRKHIASPYEEQRLKSLHRLGMKAYDEYLASHYWRDAKARVYGSRAPICYGCAKRGTHKTLIVHHADYGRLSAEPLGDLILLCHPCHNETHAIEHRTHVLRTAHKLYRAEREKSGLRVGPEPGFSFFSPLKMFSMNGGR